MGSLGAIHAGAVEEATGHRRRRLGRSGWAAIGAAVAVTLGSGGISLVRAAPEVKSDVTPIAPCRLIDTRPGAAVGTIRAPIGERQTVVIGAVGSNGACNIPSGITAIDVNLTALNVTAPRTFLTAYPAGDPRPAASQLNPTSTAGVTSNSTSITLSAGGQFALYNDAGSVNVIIDILAYYTPASGSDGAPGPRGPAGAVGAQGASGAQGPAGAQGPTGGAGAQGPAGADGDDSVPGPAGADGEDGVDGAPGPAGSDGAAGARGPAGSDGAAGAAGVDGLDGEDGVDGAPGPAGTDGVDGAAGADGVEGAPGPAGTDGLNGEPGLPGSDGVDGAAGADGVDGATGPAGPQGPAGADGDPADISYLQVTGPVSESGNPTSRTVSAVCPSGKVVVGGGFEVNSTAKNHLQPPFVTKSAPSSSNTWTVTAERGWITRDDWSVQAYAICVGI
jgi:hypothetical protein